MARTDLELISLIKNEKDSDALSELSKRHAGLFVQMTKKYLHLLQQVSGISYDDLIKEKDYIVYDAALSYDKEMGSKFSTWFGNRTRYSCLNFLDERKGTEPLDPRHLEFFIDCKHFYMPESKYSEEARIIFDHLNSLDDKRIPRIFYMKFYFIAPYNSFKHIGRQLNLSPQGTIDLYRKGLSFIKNNEEVMKVLLR